MDPAAEAFLAGRRIASLGTVNPSGSVQVNPIWYRWDGEAFTFACSPATVKARNVVARPQATVCVDGREVAVRFLTATGPAEVILGEEAVRLNRLILERYLTPAGLADPGVGGVLAEHDTATIRVVPARWHWFDIVASYGGDWGREDYLLPLEP